jgi:hypothetical protein
MKHHARREQNEDGGFLLLQARQLHRRPKVFYNEAITSYPESAIAAGAKLRLADVEIEAAKKVAPDGQSRRPHSSPRKRSASGSSLGCRSLRRAEWLSTAKAHMIARPLFCFSLSSAAQLCWHAGCSHYRSARAQPSAFRHSCIEPVVVRTLIPQARSPSSARRCVKPSSATAVSPWSTPPPRPPPPSTVTVTDYAPRRRSPSAKATPAWPANSTSPSLAELDPARQPHGENLFDPPDLRGHRELFTDSGQTPGRVSAAAPSRRVPRHQSQTAHAVLDVCVANPAMRPPPPLHPAAHQPAHALASSRLRPCSPVTTPISPPAPACVSRHRARLAPRATSWTATSSPISPSAPRPSPPSAAPAAKLFFDTHLMLSEPHRYIEAFAKAGPISSASTSSPPTTTPPPSPAFANSVVKTASSSTPARPSPPSSPSSPKSISCS